MFIPAMLSALAAICLVVHKPLDHFHNDVIDKKMTVWHLNILHSIAHKKVADVSNRLHFFVFKIKPHWITNANNPVEILFKPKISHNFRAKLRDVYTQIVEILVYWLKVNSFLRTPKRSRLVPHARIA